MTIPVDAQSLTLYAAALAAVLYLGKKALRFAHILEALLSLVQHELQHNHGTSIKDDVHGMAVSIGKLARDVDQLRHDFDSHINERKLR